jgi:hypothetical protein
VVPVRYGQTYSVQFSFKYKTRRWIMSRIVIVILIYRFHKLKYLIYYYYYRCNYYFYFSDDMNYLAFVFCLCTFRFLLIF